MVRGGSALPLLLERCAAAVAVATVDGGAALNPAACRLLGLAPRAKVAELPGAALLARAFHGEPVAGASLEWQRGPDRVPLRLTAAAVRRGDRVTHVLALFDDVVPGPPSDDVAPGLSSDEAVARLAHALRTPLTPILGWARYLLQKYPRDAGVQRAATVIERNVRVSLSLMDELLRPPRPSPAAPPPRRPGRRRSRA